jgi:hypothetical protein
MRTTVRQTENGKFAVIVVRDGADGAAEEVTTDSEWNTHAEANTRIQELKGEEVASKSRENQARIAGLDVDPKKKPATGTQRSG